MSNTTLDEGWRRSVDTLEAGYRWLYRGEILEPGDEFFMPDRWVPTGEVGVPVLTNGRYRRKIITEKTIMPNITTPPLADGYRWVKPDEILERGDEYSLFGDWVATIAAGEISTSRDRYRRKISNPGAGYRWIKVGEITESGDEYSYGNNFWRPVTFLGDTVTNPGVYRRKIITEKTNMSNTTRLVDGYRWLMPGETLEPGDEFFHDRLRKWEATISSGNLVLCGEIYRRKISEPTTPPPLADGYRWVMPDEVLESTDEHLYDGKWTTTIATGHHAVSPHIYRRKISKPPLGLTPRHIWIATRKAAVLDAIHRYLDAGKDVPAAWLEELIELTK